MRTRHGERLAVNGFLVLWLMLEANGGHCQETTTAVAQLGSETLSPYDLPPAVQRSANELAGQSDVLVLGELHGTREVPAMAAAPLMPLTTLGYNVLALEVPANCQRR